MMLPIERTFRVLFFDGARDPWTKAWPARWETVRAREMWLTAEGLVAMFTRDPNGTAHTTVLTGAWGFKPL